MCIKNILDTDSHASSNDADTRTNTSLGNARWKSARLIIKTIHIASQVNWSHVLQCEPRDFLTTPSTSPPADRRDAAPARLLPGALTSNASNRTSRVLTGVVNLSWSTFRFALSSIASAHRSAKTWNSARTSSGYQYRCSPVARPCKSRRLATFTRSTGHNGARTKPLEWLRERTERRFICIFSLFSARCCIWSQRSLRADSYSLLFSVPPFAPLPNWYSMYEWSMHKFKKFYPILKNSYCTPLTCPSVKEPCLCLVRSGRRNRLLIMSFRSSVLVRRPAIPARRATRSFSSTVTWSTL